MRKPSFVLAALAAVLTALVISATALAAAPHNRSAPTIEGQAVVGKTLSAGHGIWDNATSYTYRWLRCDDNGNGCNAIGGATEQTYDVTNADLGHTLVVCS
jgi:hypothetical protein